MMKSIFALLCSMVTAIAVAAPLSSSSEKWDACPVAWNFLDGTISSGERGEFAISLESQRAANVEFSALLTPVSSCTDGWATLGVAIVDDERNYWHLAFVQSPAKQGAGRFFELSESRDGMWNAQLTDKLKCERNEGKGTWRYGETYSFKLSMDGTGIQGEVRDADGALLFLKRFVFTAGTVNNDSAVVAVTCGRPALDASGRFHAKMAQLDASCSAICPRKTQSKPFPAYSSVNFVSKVKDESTGFFRVVQRQDGRWWTIDPLGRGVVPMGVDWVRYLGFWSMRSKRNYYLENNKKTFLSREDWEDDTLSRLKSWGFNMLGAGCDDELMYRGLIHTHFLKMGESFCRYGEDFWICPFEHRPCSAFPNVFDPRFPTYCDYMARRLCAPNKDDPWLLGYFIDNELAWWGRAARDTGLFDAVMNKPDNHSAKRALCAFLKERGVAGDPSTDVKLDFLRLAAERYFSCTTAAIRRHDPNHLVMGSRFAGIDGAHDVVWEVSGRYCDIVSFNFYPWVDLERNAVFLDRGVNSPNVTDVLAKRYSIVKRPMFVSEWSFPALDSKLPCLYGAGQRFHTQRQRAAAAELYVKTLLATPSLLGYDYFMWVDDPPEGLTDAFPEDSNYGLVNTRGEPWAELVSVFKSLQNNVIKWLNASVPPMRAASGRNKAESFLKRLPVPSKRGGVKYVRKGDGYVVTTRGGLVLSGRVGGDAVFSNVSLNGSDLGAYNAMLYHRPEGKRYWENIAKVTKVSFVERKGWGVLEVVGEGQTRGGRHSFELSQRISIHPDKPYFLCDITKVSNIGTESLDIGAFYFRQNASYAVEKKEKPRRVPSLWNAPFCDVWIRKSDGVWWGGFTTSPACMECRYFLSDDGIRLHPDASFDLAGRPPADSPKGLWRLGPGKSFEPQGTVWILCIGGKGGYDNWERQIKELE